MKEYDMLRLDERILGVLIIASYILFRVIAGPLGFEHFEKSLGLEMQDLLVTVGSIAALYTIGGYKNHTFGSRMEMILSIALLLVVPIIWGFTSKMDALKTDLNGIIKNKVHLSILITSVVLICGIFVYVSDNVLELGLKSGLMAGILSIMYFLKHKDEEIHMHHSTLFLLLGILFSENHMLMRIGANVSIGSIIHGIASYGMESNIYDMKSKLPHDYKINKYDHDYQYRFKRKMSNKWYVKS